MMTEAEYESARRLLDEAAEAGEPPDPVLMIRFLEKQDVEVVVVSRAAAIVELDEGGHQNAADRLWTRLVEPEPRPVVVISGGFAQVWYHPS